MDSRLEANLANWNDRVAVHAASKFYDVEGWLRDAPGPPTREIESLGDARGRSLVHLQCHFGMDSLQWARIGAVVTGVDFSSSAIETAQWLARRAGLATTSSFVCSNIYDAVDALGHATFDIAYVSLGSLCWLPDVGAWGEVVAQLLAPGGMLYMHDVHPFGSMFHDDGEHIVFGYFEDQDCPFEGDFDSTYTDGVKIASTRCYEWNHSIGEIVMSLVNRGLVLDRLDEHDWTVFQQFPWLQAHEHGIFVTPDDRPRVPLSFTLVAHRPG